MGWSALLKADLVALSKSWVLRGWVVVLALAEFFSLTGILLANRLIPVPASAVLSSQLEAYLLVWSTVIIVLSAGSVSLEADIVADSILSRACTRRQYILAKLAARAGVILGVYLVFAGIAAYCAWRYASNDLTVLTAITGLAIVGMALLLLVALGVTMSVVFNNTVVSVIGLLLLWYVAAPIFNFMGAEYLSPASLQRNLPAILKDAGAPQVVHCLATPTSISVTFSKSVQVAQAEQVDNYQIESPPRTTRAARTATYDASRATVVLGGLKLRAGESVKVTVRGVTDMAGNALSPAADSVVTVVSDRKANAPSKTGRASDADEKPTEPPVPGGRRRRWGMGRAGPLRVLSCVATASSLQVVFSEEVDARYAERVGNYVIESPFGRTHPAKTASYDDTTRTVLLSGLQFAAGDPVKVTVKNVRDTRGNTIGSRANSAIYTEVTTWKYVFGFGLPTLLFTLMAVVWFNHRDL